MCSRKRTLKIPQLRKCSSLVVLQAGTGEVPLFIATNQHLLFALFTSVSAKSMSLSTSGEEEGNGGMGLFSSFAAMAEEKCFWQL